MMAEQQGGGNPKFDDVAQQAALKGAAKSAKSGAKKAASVAVTGAKEVVLYVRQGPAGISLLCFLGGLVTIVLSILGLVNIFGALTGPINYLVNIYTLFFGFMIVFLEAEPERMKKSAVLGKCTFLFTWGRVRVLEYFRFATSMWGRGLFYFFVGSFGVIQWTVCSAILGIWMMVCGALLLIMQCACREKSLESSPPPAVV